MDKYNFKEAMKSLKEQKSNLKSNSSNEDNKFIRYADVIKEKIKENKKEEKILNTFDEYEKERDDWIKIKNERLNREKEEKLLNLENKEDLTKNSIKNKSKFSDNSDSDASETNLQQEFDIKISTKDYIVTIDPKDAIKEHIEQNEVKKIVDCDKFTAELKCKELYNWFHLMFQEWEKELDKLPESIKINSEGRDKLGIYKQCRGYIKPLLRLLKRQDISKEIMNKLFEIMIYCKDKDYIRAHDKYIELAIGNAPWPMGVTMVGIHERSGRSKIYSAGIAHILNDENTKKYLQSVKRVMSLVQRIYPVSPSNQVVS